MAANGRDYISSAATRFGMRLVCAAWVAFALAAFPSHGFAAGKKRPVGLSIQSQPLKDDEMGYRNYLLFIPQGYYQSSTRKWPLILFLHGSEQRGSNPALVEREGIPALVARDPTFPFIVVSPQCPAETRWSAPSLMKLLTAVEKNLRVDRSRVYLTGFSMGGFGTWRTAAAYPDVFAAIAPVCGGGDPAAAARLRKIPIWAFHGARDENVPLSESTRMVEAVRSAGGRARLTIYQRLDHEIWNRTYGDRRLYAWFLSHRRSGR